MVSAYVKQSNKDHTRGRLKITSGVMKNFQAQGLDCVQVFAVHVPTSGLEILTLTEVYQDHKAIKQGHQGCSQSRLTTLIPTTRVIKR